MKRSIQANKLMRTKLRTNRSLTSGWTERRKVSMAERDRNSPVLWKSDDYSGREEKTGKKMQFSWYKHNRI